MNSKHDNSQEIILAFLNNEMSPQQAKEFEKQINSYPGLKAEVEELKLMLDSANKWFEEETPGIIRLDDLDIPIITKETKQHAVNTRWFTQLAAACLIFALGFIFGNTASTEKTPEQKAVAEKIIVQTPTPEVEKKQPEVQPLQEAYQVASVMEQNGKIYIETNLSVPNSRALWVIDSNLEIK